MKNLLIEERDREGFMIDISIHFMIPHLDTYWIEARLDVWLFLLQFEDLWVVLLLHVISKVELATQQVQVLQEAGGRSHTYWRWSLEAKIVLKKKKMFSKPS